MSQSGLVWSRFSRAVKYVISSKLLQYKEVVKSKISGPDFQGPAAIAGQLLSFLTWATDLSETVLSKSMSGKNYKYASAG